MGLLFVTAAAAVAEHGLVGAPAVEPNPRTVPSPASGRLPSSLPATEESATCLLCFAGPVAPHRDSGSGEIVCTWCSLVGDHGPALSVRRSGLAGVRTASVVRPVPQEGSTCRSCLGGPVVPDPDSGVLVCASCGLIHDLGDTEFVQYTDLSGASLVHHAEEEEQDEEEEAAEEESKDSPA